MRNAEHPLCLAGSLRQNQLSSSPGEPAAT
jgi:hypothetical protein